MSSEAAVNACKVFPNPISSASMRTKFGNWAGVAMDGKKQSSWVEKKATLHRLPSFVFDDGQQRSMCHGGSSYQHRSIDPELSTMFLLESLYFPPPQAPNKISHQN